jgi:hypothetical protein
MSTFKFHDRRPTTGTLAMPHNMAVKVNEEKERLERKAREARRAETMKMVAAAMAQWRVMPKSK